MSSATASFSVRHHAIYEEDHEAEVVSNLVQVLPWLEAVIEAAVEKMDAVVKSPQE